VPTDADEPEFSEEDEEQQQDAEFVQAGANVESENTEKSADQLAQHEVGRQNLRQGGRHRKMQRANERGLQHQLDRQAAHKATRQEKRQAGALIQLTPPTDAEAESDEPELSQAGSNVESESADTVVDKVALRQLDHQVNRKEGRQATLHRKQDRVKEHGLGRRHGRQVQRQEQRLDPEFVQAGANVESKNTEKSAEHVAQRENSRQAGRHRETQRANQRGRQHQATRRAARQATRQEKRKEVPLIQLAVPTDADEPEFSEEDEEQQQDVEFVQAANEESKNTERLADQVA